MMLCSRNRRGRRASCRPNWGGGNRKSGERSRVPLLGSLQGARTNLTEARAFVSGPGR